MGIFAGVRVGGVFLRQEDLPDRLPVFREKFFVDVH